MERGFREVNFQFVRNYVVPLQCMSSYNLGIQTLESMAVILSEPINSIKDHHLQKQS